MKRSLISFKKEEKKYVFLQKIQSKKKNCEKLKIKRKYTEWKYFIEKVVTKKQILIFWKKKYSATMKNYSPLT